MVSEPHRFARQLRKASTRPEDILWDRLRASRFHGFKFKRQVPFDRYVADFHCHAAGLVIEVDGKQHGWDAAYDEARSKVIESRNLLVIRFTNAQVLNDLQGVLDEIETMLRLPSK